MGFTWENALRGVDVFTCGSGIAFSYDKLILGRERERGGRYREGNNNDNIFV